MSSYVSKYCQFLTIQTDLNRLEKQAGRDLVKGSSRGNNLCIKTIVQRGKSIHWATQNFTEHEFVQHGITLRLDLTFESALFWVMMLDKRTFRESSISFVPVSSIELYFPSGSGDTKASWALVGFSHQNILCKPLSECSVMSWSLSSRKRNKRHFFCLYLYIKEW